MIATIKGLPVGLGLMGDFIAREPRPFFCPGAVEDINADIEISKFGSDQVQTSYYYRHGSLTNLFDASPAMPTSPNTRLAALGVNRRGLPIKALAIDMQFAILPSLSTFGIYSRHHHRGKWCNLLFADTHVVTSENTARRYDVDFTDPTGLQAAFIRMLEVLETADENE